MKVSDLIISELSPGLESVCDSNAFEGLKSILIDAYEHERVVCGLGAGRMGYAVQSAMMRLSHLGFRSFFLGDTTLPRIGDGSVVIANSSSGETESIRLLVEIAKNAGAVVVCLTSESNSRIAHLSDHIVELPRIKSLQLMKTYYEQLSWLVFDALSFELVNLLELSVSDVSSNHSILE